MNLNLQTLDDAKDEIVQTGLLRHPPDTQSEEVLSTVVPGHSLLLTNYMNISFSIPITYSGRFYASINCGNSDDTRHVGRANSRLIRSLVIPEDYPSCRGGDPEPLSVIKSARL